MRPEMPSLTALLSFEAALRYGSFTRAAEELGRTQGAISRQVALLERQLGVSLFTREGARLRPSAVGRSYGDKLGGILDRLAALTLEVQASGEVGSNLNLAILPSFGTRWLIPRIPGFNAAHPEVRLHLTTRIGTFDFEAEGFDAAIHHGQAHWPGAQLEELMREEVLVVCRADRAADIRELRDLLEQPRLQLQSRRRAWPRWFRRVGLEEQDAGRGPLFEHHMMVIQAALAGLGVALLPSFLIEDELADGRLVCPFPELRFPGLNGYYLAFPETNRQLPALTAFRAWIKAEFEG
jgi:LysR family transcriptional regulator, glycine cleavage system transcriptional activator